MRSDTPPFDPTALTRHARLLAQMLRTVALPDAPVPCMDGVVYAADWLDQLQPVTPTPPPAPPADPWPPQEGDVWYDPLRREEWHAAADADGEMFLCPLFDHRPTDPITGTPTHAPIPVAHVAEPHRLLLRSRGLMPYRPPDLGPDGADQPE